MSPSRKQRGPNRKFTRLEGKAIGESMIAGKYLNQSQEVEFGVIQDIHKEVGMDCVFYKRVRTRVARNEDFIALNEFMGYFESGEFTWVGHGKKGTELAKQIFRESQ